MATNNKKSAIHWIGEIGSEGEPLMIASLNNFKKWGGINNELGKETSDYDSLIEKKSFIDTFFFKKFSALSWQTEGAGEISIGFNKEDNEIFMLRTWVDDEADQEKIKEFVTNGKIKEIKKKDLIVEDKLLLIACATLSMQNLSEYNFDGEDFNKSINKKLDKKAYIELEGDYGTGAIVLNVIPGNYKVTIKSIEKDDCSARWCRLKLIK